MASNLQLPEKLVGEKQIRPTHSFYPEMVLRFDLAFAHCHKSRTRWKFYCLPPANVEQRQYLVVLKSRADFTTNSPTRKK